MNTQKDCPICMEIIDFNKNCVTTECGHCFHTNCLMTSVAHNGFGCPYCRTAMAEEIKDEEEEEDDDESYYESDDEQEDIFDDYSLRGFRFFMNNISGEPHEQEDIEEEDEDIRDRIRDAPPRPSAEFIVDKLLEDDISVEDLVKVLLLEHEEYDDSQEDLSRIESSVFRKIKTIISNFNPGEGLPRVNNLMSMINERTECITYDWNTLFVHEEQLEYTI